MIDCEIGERHVKRLLPLGLLLLVAGCAGHNIMAIDKVVTTNPGKNRLALVIHESPEFMAMTADRSMFLNADVDKAYADGKRLVRESGLEDPADRICRMMAAAMQNKYGLQANESAMIKARSKKTDDMVRLANGKDYVLDVETEYWYFINKEHKQPLYFVKYIASLRIIDATRGTTIGKSSCDYDTMKGGKPLVSYEKLVADGGAYIKQSLDDAAAFCVDKFTGELQ